MATVLFCKTFYYIIFMLPDSFVEIIRYSNIQGTAFAGHNINKVLLILHRLRDSSARDIANLSCSLGMTLMWSSKCVIPTDRMHLRERRDPLLSIFKGFLGSDALARNDTLSLTAF